MVMVSFFRLIFHIVRIPCMRKAYVALFYALGFSFFNFPLDGPVSYARPNHLQTTHESAARSFS